LIWAGCLVPFFSSVSLFLWYWPGAIPLDVTSGVWTALAKDFAEGVLYRPVFDGAGYGGTRYMPAFFMLHGALLRLAIDPVTAGLSLTVASVILIDVVLYLTLREVGVRAVTALPLALMGHATISFQLLTLNVKGDLLAAALNLAAILFALKCVRRPSALLFAACVGAPLAAVFTKLSAVGGLLASLWLFRVRRGWRWALTYGGAVGALIVISLAALYWASAGRVLDSFLAVGSGGGDLGYAWRFPLWFGLVVVQDPPFLLIFGTALFYAARATQSRRWSFPLSYFWLTTLLTLPIFASRGTDNNHLIDLLAASILLLGYQLERAPLQARAAVALPLALAGLTTVSWIPGKLSFRGAIVQEGKPTRRKVAAIIQRLGPGARDVLSENPIVAVMAGQRPVVSDPFSLRILAAELPAVRADFARRLAGREFDAVVLVDWSGSPIDRMPGALRARSDVGVGRFYGEVHFPPGSLDLVERNYALRFIEHPFVVFQPRGSGVESLQRAPPGGP